MTRLRRIATWPPAARWALGAAVVLAGASIPVLRYLVFWPLDQWQVDVEVYREAGVSILTGRPIYSAMTEAPQLLPFTYPPFAAVLAMGHARDLRRLANPAVMFRAFLDVLGTFGYLVALFNMPISIATAINMAAPLAICVLAVIWLREQVGWRRWSAIIAGFVGVLLIIRPTPGGLDWWALLCFGATVLKAAPGMTGLWQVSGRNDLTFEQRLRVDEYYVRNWSPWMDLVVLIKTVTAVVQGRGAY